MESDFVAILELLLIFGAVLALAVAQLVSLRRAKRRAETAHSKPESGDQT